MTVEDITSELKLQIDDTADEALLTDEQYVSIVSRSLLKVNAVLGMNYQISDDGISPELSSDSLEFLTVQSLVFLSETMRAKVAKNFSFKSGDKQVDKTKQPAFWADLHKDFLSRLHTLTKRLAPHLDDKSMLLGLDKYPIPEVYEVSSNA